MENEKEILRRAILFAAEKHLGQTRNDKAKTPYIEHPKEVMELLQLASCSIKAMIIAILHDTLEDTNTTEDEIEKEFGNEILILLKEVTDNAEQVFNRLIIEYGEETALTMLSDKKMLTRQFKEQQVINMPNMAYESKVVKIADKISNIRSILENPPKWSKDSMLGYTNVCKRIVDAGRGTNKYLEDLFDNYFNAVIEKLRD